MDEPKKMPAHAGVNIIPPYVLGGLLGFSIFMHLIAPVELGMGIALRGLGALIMGLCFAWIYWCGIMFRKHKTALPPNKPTSAIVKTGPYAISRNPIYLAMIVGYVGIALMADVLWFWFTLPALVWYLRYYVIPREEAYLTRVFSMSYMNYCRKVRRWV